MIPNELVQVTAPSEILINEYGLSAQSHRSTGFTKTFCDAVFPITDAVTAVSGHMTALRCIDELVYINFTLHLDSCSSRRFVLAAGDLINVETFDCHLLRYMLATKLMLGVRPTSTICPSSSGRT